MHWPQRQTSLIMDPPDGRLPALTPEGTRRMMLMKSSWAWMNGEPQTWDSYEDFDHWDRCITRGLPASMGPYRYNNGMQIIQAPGVVILNLEMIHEARIVYTDGRPSPNTSVIQQYMGESRGKLGERQHAGDYDDRHQARAVDDQHRHRRFARPATAFRRATS